MGNFTVIYLVMGHNSSAEAEKQPYQRIRFWLQPENQFWNNGYHSQKSKDYFNKWLAKWYDKEKSTHKFLPDIKRS